MHTLFAKVAVIYCITVAVVFGSDRSTHSFKEKHENAVYYGPAFDKVDQAHSSPNLIAGARLATGASPVESVNNLISSMGKILPADYGVLQPKSRSGKVAETLYFDRSKGKAKMFSLRFQQMYAGLPVHGGGVDFLVKNTEGFPVEFVSSTLRDFSGRALDVKLETPTVTDTMKDNAMARLGVEPGLRSVLENSSQEAYLETANEQLVIWAGHNSDYQPPQVAVTFDAKKSNHFESFHIVASAETNEILAVSKPMPANLTSKTISEPVSLRSGTAPTTRGSSGATAPKALKSSLSGIVLGNVTTSPESHLCAGKNTDVETPLPLVKVVLFDSRGREVETTFADAGGNFSFTSRKGAKVRAYLDNGTIRVNDSQTYDGAGAPSLIPFTETTDLQSAVILKFNPDPNAKFLYERRSLVNAYYHGNIAWQFAYSYLPADLQALFDLQDPLTYRIVDNPSTYSQRGCIGGALLGAGSDIIELGGQGSDYCASMVGDVLYHEFSHYVFDRIGLTQSEDLADVLPILIGDDPHLVAGAWHCANGPAEEGQSVPTPGNEPSCDMGLRTAENNLTRWSTENYCQTSNSQKNQAIVWHTQKALNDAGVADYLDVSARLFFGYLLANDQDCFGDADVKSYERMSLIYLCLDEMIYGDGDFDFCDGTPHFEQIKEGFSQHMAFIDPFDPGGTFNVSEYRVFRGTHVSGDVSDLQEDDDSFLKFHPGFTLNSEEPEVWIEFDVEIPCDIPTSIEFEIFSEVNTLGITQTFELFDYASGKIKFLEASDPQPAATSDNPPVEFTSNSKRILIPAIDQGSDLESPKVTLRVGWKKTGFTTLFPWTVSIDKILVTTEAISVLECP